MDQVITAIMLIGVILLMIPGALIAIKRTFIKLNKRVTKRKHLDLFDVNYIDAKTFYLQEFGRLPCISYVNNLDVSKAFDYINDGHAGVVVSMYQRSYYNWQDKKLEFSKTLFKLDNMMMIELGYDHADLLFDTSNSEYAYKMVKQFVEYKASEKGEAFEINIITVSNNTLELKPLYIKPTILDLSLYYNDDFKAVDEVIRQRLETDNDKGI